MATTTNYGWETPDDTDLVKDGAAAIRTLGSSIDTTTKNLNPQTTTGALAYRSATANINTALPIGTTGQVLTVASGVPSWATPSTGALALITTNTFSAQSSVNIDNVFSSTYDNYKILFTFDSASVNQSFDSIRLRVSGSNTTSNYKTFRNFGYTGTVASGDLDPVGTDEIFIADNGTSFNGASITDMTLFSPNRAKYTVATIHSAYNWGSYTNATISAWQTDSTQFTGFTLLVSSGTITGNVSVYGFTK